MIWSGFMRPLAPRAAGDLLHVPAESMNLSMRVTALPSICESLVGVTTDRGLHCLMGILAYFFESLPLRYTFISD